MVLPLQGEAVLAVVEFANLEEITSWNQVEEIFRRYPFPRGPWKTLKDIDPVNAVEAFTADQGIARGWLDQFANRGGLKKQDLDTVQEWFTDAVGLIFEWTFEAGRPHANFLPSLSGVQACIAYAMAALTADCQLADRVGVCDLPECTSYFFNPGRGGLKNKYCLPGHSGIARQRRHRRANPG